MLVVYIGGPAPLYSAYRVPYGSVHTIQEIDDDGNLRIDIEAPSCRFGQTYSKYEFIAAETLTKLERILYELDT